MNETYTDNQSLEIVFDLSLGEDTYNCESNDGNDSD